MISQIKENIQFFYLLILWLVTGIWGGGIIYIVLPLSLILLKKKEMYGSLLVGFFFILILSDSRLSYLGFAGNVKNIYISLLSLFFFFDIKSFYPVNKFYQTFIPFLLIGFFVLIYSPEISIALQKTISYALLLVIIPNYTEKAFREKGPVFFKQIIFFVAILLLVGLILRLTNPDIALFAGRYRGILGNPNGMGIFSLLFLILFFTIDELFADLFNKKEKRFILVIALLSVVLSGSRTSIISILIFYFFRHFYKVSTFLGFIIFIITIMLQQIVIENLPEIINWLNLQDFFRIETLENASGRFVAWIFAWRHIQDNFFLGRGFFFTEYLYILYFDFLSKLGHQGATHNAFLTFWLDTGLIGLILFLYGFFSKFIQSAKASRLAIPIMYSIIFSIIFESWITASLNPFTIQFIIILTIMTSAEIRKNSIPVYGIS